MTQPTPLKITAQEIIARAHALAPTLRERSAGANEARRLSAQTIQDMKDAGFFRILQPSRYGGYEMDPRVFFEVQTIVAAACPSTAWVLGVVAVHNWQLALFDPKAQEEVWGEDTSVLISSSYMPVGKVTPVEGGYRFSGRWGFSSGSDHCDWAFLGGFVPPSEASGGHPDMRTIMIPKSDYRIEDTWHVAGLKGTGSNDVVVEDVFVPEHRTHRFADGFRQKSPGHAVNDAPLFKLPFGQLFVRSVSSTSIGVLQGMLDAYKEVIGAKISRADGAKVAEDHTAQALCAKAATTLRECRIVLDQNFEEMMDCVTHDRPIDMEKRVQYRYDSSRTVERCHEAVNALFSAGGGGALFLDHPMQRYFQDMQGCRAHYANNPTKPGENLGRVLFGQKTRDFFI